jgi:hypothetical protein
MLGSGIIIFKFALKLGTFSGHADVLDLLGVTSHTSASTVGTTLIWSQLEDGWASDSGGRVDK